jgi:hypothetical protein
MYRRIPKRRREVGPSYYKALFTPRAGPKYLISHTFYNAISYFDVFYSSSISDDNLTATWRLARRRGFTWEWFVRVLDNNEEVIDFRYGYTSAKKSIDKLFRLIAKKLMKTIKTMSLEDLIETLKNQIVLNALSDDPREVYSNGIDNVSEI